MAQTKILIVDDDVDISEIIHTYLTKYDFSCQQAYDAAQALRLAREYCPDLLILDVQLPGASGIDVCRQLRQETDAPILFLSCLGEEQDKISGLEAGGDDYIAKPFSLGELLARVKAALRRSGLPETATAVRKHILSFPGLTIDLVNSQAVVDETIIDLPPMEFQLLSRLARNPGWTYSNEQLFSLVWGSESIDTRTVAVHINRLRKKLEQNAAKREYILTVWGKGYKFNDQL
ncbi:response regulator transcription factor [Azotosporobacter soli]|uniref:response regulator transcription factor n=1 Tax=Azotosporobacter soli TaxID=3055040 RepID=UPI0031FEC551